VTAEICVRCGRPMVVVEAPPPVPVYIPPPPPPVVVPEPQKVAWWVWALLASGVVAIAVLLVLSWVGVFG